MTATITRSAFFTQRDIDDFRVAVYLMGAGEPIEEAQCARFVELNWLARTASVRSGYEVTPQGLNRLP